MEFADALDQPMVGVSVAVDSVRTGVTHLIKLADDGGFNDLDAAGLVGLLRDFQGVLNLLPVFDQALIQHCVEQRIPEELCFRNVRAVLVSSLQVSPGEAGRRVKAASWFADRHSVLGETLEPARPLIAAAQRAGGLNPEQARVIAYALEPVDGKGFDPADVAAGEQILVDAARYTGPVDLKLLGQRVVEAIDPDGTLPDDDRQAGQRFFRMRQSAKDGSWSGEFRLTNVVGQKLRAVIDSLIRPVVTNCTVQSAKTDPNNSNPKASDSNGGNHDSGNPETRADESGAAGGGLDGAVPADADQADRTGASQAEWPETRRRNEAAADDPAQASAAQLPVEPDVRNFEQRQHDALEQVLDWILRSNTLPDTGGVPATIIVTIDENVLLSGRGAGRFANGSLVSAATVADLTDEAEIVRVSKTSVGAVLNLGRTRRLASRSQTLALIARDGGCSFPNCTIQPDWCERHHIVEWQHGGPTNLDNLTLVCRYHHRYFQQRGWKCEINIDRLPVWTPPKWQDPNQTPILHP